ncbi:MAG TPA: PAS domain-containing protein, partial [Candidatus Fimisoma avicola]|nr:PAS domain-containing protein [Candidatus Fimisoma avicola]
MLTVKDLANPNITNKRSDLTVNQNMNLKDIDLNIFGSSFYEYTNVTDDDGNIVGAVKTERLVYMITKHKENSFIQILDTMDAGIVVIDMDSRIFYVNPAYGRILNINISKILGRYMSIIEPEATLLDVIRTRKGKKVQNQHIKSINKYVDINTHPLINDGVMTG